MLTHSAAGLFRRLQQLADVLAAENGLDLSGGHWLVRVSHVAGDAKPKR
jgi:hypothetical protein